MHAEAFRRGLAIAVLAHGLLVIGIHLDRASCGKDVGGALDIERLPGGRVERHQAHRRALVGHRCCLDPDGDGIGDQIGQKLVGHDLHAHVHRLIGKVDRDLRGGRKRRHQARRQVGEECVLGDLLLVGVAIAAGKRRGGCQDAGVGGGLQVVLDADAIGQVDRSGDSNGEGDEAERRQDADVGRRACRQTAKSRHAGQQAVGELGDGRHCWSPIQVRRLPS